MDHCSKISVIWFKLQRMFEFMQLSLQHSISNIHWTYNYKSISSESAAAVIIVIIILWLCHLKCFKVDERFYTSSSRNFSKFKSCWQTVAEITLEHASIGLTHSLLLLGFAPVWLIGLFIWLRVEQAGEHDTVVTDDRAISLSTSDISNSSLDLLALQLSACKRRQNRYKGRMEKEFK